MHMTNNDDVIDSREIIERIAELQAMNGDDYGPEGLEDTETVLESSLLDDDERDELSALEALASCASEYVEDWEDGATLIRDSYFEDYAREYAEECGYMETARGQRGISWPFTCIDWEQAARELQSDYTSLEFAGVTYWAR